MVIIMKKAVALLAGVVLTLSVTACGGNKALKVSEVEKISPDTLLTAKTVSTLTGVTMKVSDDGVTNDGSARSVTYVPDPIGSADTVTVRVEQFSEALTVSQVWADYENSRLRREDHEFVEGIGQDCYIAFPYINVYDRGCFIRISAGSGDDDEQKELLQNLAKTAAVGVESIISAETADAAASNVIK